MTNFIIKQLPYDLSSQGGLALVGQYLKQINLNALTDPRFPVRAGSPNSTLLKSYLALLCLGKNDFDAIEAFRQDAFFMRALGITQVPSSPTLRQRLDAHAPAWFALTGQINEALLQTRIAGRPIDFGLLPCGYMPLDLDTFAMDNSGTKKEHVGRTYAGIDGYCPLAVYMGRLGYCLDFALRPGVQHSAHESQYNLEHVLPLAARLVSAPLLVRADSGFCSKKLIKHIQAQAQSLQREIAVLIKWNPRTTPVESLAYAKTQDASTAWSVLREGKRECLWQENINDSNSTSMADEDVAVALDAQRAGGAHVLRRIYRLTERSIDKHGHALLLPEYVLEGWTTSLPATFAAQAVIDLYCDHATHEQFHAEFKSDMDLERLPSGKFDTNYLVCQLAAIAMNLLRLVGQNTLNAPHTPVRHTAQRRRIKTVIREIMLKAARMIHHAGRWSLGLGENDKGFTVFAQHYDELCRT
jgi:Transposase DDE domain group 1